MSYPSDYYISCKSRLLKEFNLYVKYSRTVLGKQFGEENIDAVVAATRKEFEDLIPQLPYVGGKQPFTQFIVATGLSLVQLGINRSLVV